jgi:hypothetical protein
MHLLLGTHVVGLPDVLGADNAALRRRADALFDVRNFRGHAFSLTAINDYIYNLLGLVFSSQLFNNVRLRIRLPASSEPSYPPLRWRHYAACRTL